MELLRRHFIPVASAFVIFVAMALYARRQPIEAPAVPGGGRRAIIAHHLVTVVGGYAVFLLIVLVFHVLIAGQTGALRSAAKGGGFLAFAVALPVFVLGSLVRAHRHR